MPLDPYTKGLLDMLVEAQRPKTWQLTPPEAREGMLALVKYVDAKDVPIGRIDDASLPGPTGPLAYRCYTPVGATAAQLPGLIYFHGGGFVIGDLDTHDGMCRLLANASGCRLVSCAYRLAPEHKFPAAINDGFAAARWVAEHTAELGIDLQRLAIGGDSAGGNLAAVVCLLAKRAGGPVPALQVLFCPRTDGAADTQSMRDFATGYLLEQKSIDWFAAHYGAPDLFDFRVSPLRAEDVAGLPPLHMHTAEFDPLRDEGKAYADRLAAAGVATRYVCHPGMIHHFYAMAGAIPYGRTALEAAGAAIKQALA